MLSRIARSLCELARDLERSQNMARVLEVNHKMHLQRSSLDAGNPWTLVAEAFDVETPGVPTEASVYEALVFSEVHEDSVLRCVRAARENARAARDHISEEVWSHLNRHFLESRELDFGAVLRMGRSEFNRRIDIGCDALFGLAESTMIHDAPWHFLRIGRYLERARMIARILGGRRKDLVPLGPTDRLRPLDVHQWQTLLRSVSGYEPYRRAHDARILPERVLDFVVREATFPRSLLHALGQVSISVRSLASTSPSQIEWLAEIDARVAEIARLDAGETLASGGLDAQIQHLQRLCDELWIGLEKAYFSSVRPLPAASLVPVNAGLVPQ